MHDTAYYVHQVRDFHGKHDAPIGPNVTNRGVLTLRKSLVYEEAGEVMLALHDKDELELIDGLGDLLYVTAGMWVAMIGVQQLPGKLNLVDFTRPALWDHACEKVIHNRVDAVVDFTANIVTGGYFHLAIYNAVLALHELGYDPKAVFDEIHSSNMTKTPTKGDIRVRVKGPDYRAPDLSRFLRG